jgi:hypothetical protein
MNRRQVCHYLILFFGAVSTLGCGTSDGPERLNVSGTVSFRGQPVATGAVYFTPDAKRGNRGPQGMARIYNGKFETTDRGKGIMAGPQIVEIRGFGPASTSGDMTPFSRGKPLFPPYSLEIEATDEKTTFDFDVPESAARREAG